MKRVFLIPILALPIAAPSAAQDAGPDCRDLASFTSAVRVDPDDARTASVPCPGNEEDSRWARVVDAMHEFTVDPVRQTDADPSERLRAAQAEIQRLDGERPRLEIGRRSATERAIQGPERGSGIDATSPAQPVSGYEEVLALLQGSGMAWAEACALARADAHGVDWLTAGRRCVTERTGAGSYREFLEVLLAGNVSARDACVAAEHYWNGLSEGKARTACGIRG